MGQGRASAPQACLDLLATTDVTYVNHPSFFVAGVGRSGSSSLYHSLQEHPEIYMSPMKEPNFFHWDGETHRHEGPIDAMIYRNAIKSWDEYRALFADIRDEKVSGEATPSYLYNPKVPERIHRRCPGAKVVVILRDPADRAFSQYQLMLQLEREELSFEQALDAESERREKNWGPSYHYCAQGFYSQQIRHWQSILGSDALHCVLFDDLKLEPKAVLRDVYAFLGVDPAFEPHTGRVHNASYKPRRAWLHQILTGDNALKRAAKLVVPDSLRKDLWWKLHARNKDRGPELLPATRLRLIELYREDISSLQELIGRELPSSSWLAPLPSH